MSLLKTDDRKRKFPVSDLISDQPDQLESTRMVFRLNKPLLQKGKR